jgi:hypothetical protein
LPSQGKEDGRIRRIAYFLENYNETDNWQGHYIRGRCSYVCRTKQGRKHVPYGELVGTTECVTRCRTNRSSYNRVQLYYKTQQNAKCLSHYIALKYTKIKKTYMCRTL